MASLNKLAIRGIRSFDDKQISVIEFFSPVTVIVGHNGSGKTTIIECLKYATTGDQPPNTRGGAFVHDPKMANEKEVKAQVKLRFHAANGARMLAVRNLSVSVKKTAGLTMKTLESILALADNNADKGGKRGVISTKCAEIDTEIPHLLGVSKSVLENVIFCHQEDSYWPLAEPAALKKKFDDIFEATRYTKALDSIKTLRKDRVAELKVDKERLESLLREKTHADKLKARISDLSGTIAAKKIEHEQLKSDYDQIVLVNAKFYDSSTKFRTTFIQMENLEERKNHYQKELEDAKETLQQEVHDTDEQLEQRLANFDKHIMQQKQKRKTMDVDLQDAEEELARLRKEHVSFIQVQGELAAEEKAQAQLISDREKLIQDISSKHNIKGYDHSPLEREKVIEFMGRLNDLLKKQRLDVERLQAEARAKNEDYNTKSRKLHSELEAFKQQKTSTQNQITQLRRQISDAERQIEVTQSLQGELKNLGQDMEEKRARMEKIKADIKATDYEAKINEKVANARAMDDKRDTLNTELRSLSLQADTRAQLDMKRKDLKSKTQEVANTLEINKAKFRALVGVDARADSMERDLERVIIDKDREHIELENQSNSVNKSLQQAETTVSNFHTQLKSKRDELKELDKRLKRELEVHDTVDVAIKEASDELNHRKELSGTITGAGQIYESLLRTGTAKKLCTACNRHLADHELPVFEKYLKDQMKKTSPEAIAANREEMEEWEGELKRLQALSSVEGTRDRLRDVEIPALERQIKDQEAEIPAVIEKAELASEKFNEAKKELRDLQVMKQHAISVSRAQKDIANLDQDIARIEGELSATGSTRTASDVQDELDTVTMEIRANEKEKQKLTADRDRQLQSQRSYETDLHNIQLSESKLQNQLHERTNLEERVQTMVKEVAQLNTQMKDIDAKISASGAPIDRLDQEYKQITSDSTARVTSAQTLSQEINMSVDKIFNINKVIERYVRDKRGRQLKETEEKIESLEKEITEMSESIERIRDTITALHKEINEGGAVTANLRDNIRVRKLLHEIAATQEKMDKLDMDAAHKARRLFDEKFASEKQKESELQGKTAHVEGEVTSLKAQLKTLESDFSEFKNIHKRYTEQLIKVKMSDMANNDLEKYGKALDNAIMKYHSLKMEEVNDSMRHLWNKTYQGTDIDGIKIRSDSEGGATKRSYNYRVVMTKDQVEMDMRGRCSAGQKMLASIIIRLALSDSFGQNCGILALDEPTNALDVENIDALAASLVDIINERKNHANFQLIIITHDENFLRKLGQSDVMEYYWRVSRDSRQKSVIERQRFG